MLSRRLLRIKVIKGLYAHLKSESTSMTASERELVRSIDAVYDLYHQMLALIVDVAEYANRRIEIGLNKMLPTPEELAPNHRFADNGVIRRVAASKDLAGYLKKKRLGWSRSPEVVKSLYGALTESGFYAEYMAAGAASFGDDARLVARFYEDIVLESEAVEEAVEEQSALWADNVDFAVVMAVRTINGCRANDIELQLLPQYRSDDDRVFARELFRASLSHYADNLSVIERFTRNWDVDRIAFLDNVIMTVALAELQGFESIPVRVTLDEYIEISKYYSTPSSGHFINGVLDRAVEYLASEGRINKTGRGLV